jgi:hypothetical protein
MLLFITYALARCQQTLRSILRLKRQLDKREKSGRLIPSDITIFASRHKIFVDDDVLLGFGHLQGEYVLV